MEEFYKSMEKRLLKLGEELNKKTVGSEEAVKIEREIADIWRILLEGRKLEFEKIKSAQNFELEDKKMEIEKEDRTRRFDLEDKKIESEGLDRTRRFDLEDQKFEVDRRNADRENRKFIWDWILNVVKIAATVGGAFAMLIFTLVIEDKTIISQKAWSIITKFIPKMVG